MMVFRKINRWLRSIVADNVILYKLWFYSIRWMKGDDVRLPNKSDDLYFDGYPRSGNTFFCALIKNTFPKLSFAHHLHSKSGLKIALSYNLKSFILIREPKEAVSSYLFMKVNEDNFSSIDNLIDRLIISYINYYLLVKEELDSLRILKFESCINDQVLTIKSIAEEIGMDVYNDNFYHEKLKKVQAKMEDKEQKKNSHASSLPDKERNNFKKKFKKRVTKSPHYIQADNLYSELSEYDLLKLSI